MRQGQRLSGHERALVHNNLAYFLAVQEIDGADALDMVNKAINVIGPVPEFLDTRAMALLATGEAQTAIVELERVVANSPSGLRCYHLAVAHQAANERQAAVQAMRQAHEDHQLTADQIPAYERHKYQAFSTSLPEEWQTCDH